MSINSRIKERREALRMSRNELAEKIGVTASAVANYENEISSPKAEVMYKIFNVLQCDANYLYQDEIAADYSAKVSFNEMQHIEKYRRLDDIGREHVESILTWETDRIRALSLQNGEFRKKGCPMAEAAQAKPAAYQPDYLMPNAAHVRTDIHIPQNASIDENNIMDDENF